MSEDGGSDALYDASKPVVCTIDAAEFGPHLETLERLRGAVGSVDRSDDGVVVRFPASVDTANDLDRFVTEEAQCCEFWGFGVSETDDEQIVLRWEGPPETQPFMDLLLNYLRGEVPVGSLFGLPQPPQQVQITEPGAKQ